MADEDTINFHITREDAKKLPDEKKVDVLIDLGFESNIRMVRLEQVLHGTGKPGDKPGMCEVVACHTDKLAFLTKVVWIILTVVGAAAVGVIFAGMVPGTK
jgi:hypothetical protein